MKVTGVRYEITDAYLVDLVYHDKGYYSAIINFNKLMLNGLNYKRLELELRNPELKTLKMFIDIKKNYEASIYKIEARGEAPKKSSTKQSEWSKG